MLNQIAAGGQTWAHRLRMFRQVLKLATIVGLVFSLIFLSILLKGEKAVVFQGAWYHLKARAVGHFSDEMSVSSSAWGKIDRSTGNCRVNTRIAILRTRPYYDRFWKVLEQGILRATKVFGAAFWSALVFFFIRGVRTKRRKHLSGGRLVSALRLSWHLRLFRKASWLKLGRLPLLKDSETSHTLVTGGTGAGKTNCFHLLLEQIQRAQQRSVIVDTTGAFVQRYFRPGDTVLNPFSHEAAPWHPWIECQDSFDQDALAESLIPIAHSEKESYWRSAARALFVSVFQETSVSCRNSELARWLLVEPLSHLCEFIQGTPAASFVDINSEKTAGSIRSVAASFLKGLNALKDTQTPFSIRNWVQQGDGWLFLSCTPAQRATLKPLLACWLSIAVRSLMRLPEDRDRRLWFAIDELPSLDHVRDLELLLSESRKYGGCALLALQSPAQLDAIYGQEGAQTILANCATKLIFAERDPQIAQRLSKSFGEEETLECQEGISYGAHQARDGVNLSHLQKHRPVVSASQIQSLRVNEAMVRLAGRYPSARVRLPIARP